MASAAASSSSAAARSTAEAASLSLAAFACRECVAFDLFAVFLFDGGIEKSEFLRAATVRTEIDQSHALSERAGPLL